MALEDTTSPPHEVYSPNVAGHQARRHHNEVLDRFEQNIFRLPYTSDGKDHDGMFAPVRRLPKDVALATKPYIEINGPRRLAYMGFDIDRELGGLAWEDANVPPPNIVAINPANGHAHLVYELEKPIWLAKDAALPDSPPMQYYKAVRRAMSRAMGADQHYNGKVSKNPLHQDWRVITPSNKPYDLAELSRNLDLSEPAAELVEQGEGRNCTLFGSLRLWAYKTKFRYGQFIDFRDALTDELDRLNNELANPITSSRELRGIVKSVATWTWTKYRPKVKRGIMNLDSTLSLHVRQQLGQTYTSERRVEHTREKIARAFIKIEDEGSRLSKTAVAKKAGVSRQTVSRYWPSLKEETGCLRHKSSREAATPQGLDSLKDSQFNTFPLWQDYYHDDPEPPLSVDPIPSPRQPPIHIIRAVWQAGSRQAIKNQYDFHRDTYSMAWSHARWAKTCGISQTRLREALRFLAKDGAVEIRRRANMTNEYIFHGIDAVLEGRKKPHHRG